MFEINEEFSSFPFVTISPMWDFKALQGNVKHFPTLKRPEENFNISAPFPFSAPVAVAIPIPSEPSPSLLRQPLMLSFLNELKSKDLKIAELDDKVADQSARIQTVETQIQEAASEHALSLDNVNCLLNEAVERNNSLVNEIESKDREIAQSARTLEETTSELEAGNTELQKIKEKAKAASRKWKADRMTLEKQFEEQEKAFGRARRNLMAKNEEASQSMSYQIYELEKEMKTLNNECDRLKADNGRIIELMYSEIERVYEEFEDARDEEIETLRARLIELEDDNNSDSSAKSVHVPLQREEKPKTAPIPIQQPKSKAKASPMLPTEEKLPIRQTNKAFWVPLKDEEKTPEKPKRRPVLSSVTTKKKTKSTEERDVKNDEKSPTKPKTRSVSSVSTPTQKKTKSKKLTETPGVKNEDKIPEKPKRRPVLSSVTKKKTEKTKSVEERGLKNDEKSTKKLKARSVSPVASPTDKKTKNIKKLAATLDDKNEENSPEKPEARPDLSSSPLTQKKSTEELDDAKNEEKPKTQSVSPVLSPTDQKTTNKKLAEAVPLKSEDEPKIQPASSPTQEEPQNRKLTEAFWIPLEKPNTPDSLSPGTSGHSGAGPPPPPLPGMGGPSFPLPLPFGMKPKKKWPATEIPLRNIYWDKIKPQSLAKTSLWVTATDDVATPEIVDAFFDNFQKTPQIIKETDNSPNSNEFKLLTAKQEQNLSILLAGSALKEIDNETIQKGILACDKSILTDSILQQLIKYMPSPMPSPEQIKQLQEQAEQQQGDMRLSRATQLVITLAAIEDLVPRLEAILFKEHQYDEMVKEIMAGTAGIINACKMIKSNEKFRGIVELVLAIGNYMNAGTARGGAVGFQICFLPKLMEIKDTQNQKTLLHYLVDKIENHFPHLILTKEDFDMDLASRMSPEEINQIFTQMVKSFNKLQKLKAPEFTEFANEAKQKIKESENKIKEMKGEYLKLAAYLTFDGNNYRYEDFISDFQRFANAFQQCRTIQKEE